MLPTPDLVVLIAVIVSPIGC